MNDNQEEPITPGCPSLMPHNLPGGFDGVEPSEDKREEEVHAAHVRDVSEVVSRLLLDLREGHGRPAPCLRRWQALHRKRNQPPLDGGSSEGKMIMSDNKWRDINADSGEKTWLTPKHIIDALGHFDTDPCCPPNMPWRTADRMLTKEDDGTTAPWIGRVWCNPPYGREALPFLERMARYQGGGYCPYLCANGHGRMATPCVSVCALDIVSQRSASFLPRRWNGWRLRNRPVCSHRIHAIRH